MLVSESMLVLGRGPSNEYNEEIDFLEAVVDVVPLQTVICALDV